MKKVVTGNLKTIVSAINGLDASEIEQLTKLLEESGNVESELMTKKLNSSLMKRATLKPKTVSKFIGKTISDIVIKQNTSNKEKLSLIGMIFYESISLVAGNFDVTAKSIVSKISSANRQHNTKTENTYFKYWFKDPDGVIHRWKGTGLPPKGFHDLILMGEIEDYNVIKTQKPREFDFKNREE